MGIMVSPAKHIPIDEVRAQFDRLLADLERDGGEVVVTRDGRPVARLTAPGSEPKRVPGLMKGSVLRYERPLDPVLDPLDSDS